MKRTLPLVVLAATSALSAQAPKPEVTVAAAANLSAVFNELGPRFEAETGVHPLFSFGSTAQLAQQIENGAPYDVFASADVDHVVQLERKGAIAAGSRAVYATGILALWSPSGKANKPQDLINTDVRVIALANPDLAPYGLAARETLQRLGIWKQVEPKIAYADNINMAKQYGTSGNADAVFTAYSLVLSEKGKVIQIPENLHAPIDQALGIVAASKRKDRAKQFVDYLLKGKGRDQLVASGYRVTR